MSGWLFASVAETPTFGQKCKSKKPCGSVGETPGFGGETNAHLVCLLLQLLVYLVKNSHVLFGKWETTDQQIHIV